MQAFWRADTMTDPLLAQASESKNQTGLKSVTVSTADENRALLSLGPLSMSNQVEGVAWGFIWTPNW